MVKGSRIINITLVGLTLIPVGIFSAVNSLRANAQTAGTAVIFDPPSNIRVTPNGAVLCSVRSVQTIDVYGSYDGWYKTDVCGDWGYIYRDQIRLQSAERYSVACDVVNIQQGQLALRFEPGGRSRAGLDNGNTVRLIERQGIWAYVRVLAGESSSVNGLQGWVNSNYLSCYGAD